MTAPDARDELREALAEVVRRWWGPGAADPRIVREFAEVAEKQARARAAEELRKAADALDELPAAPSRPRRRAGRRRPDGRPMIRRWWPVLRDALTNMAGLVRDWRQR